MVWFFKSLKASGKCHSSSSMRRLALTEEFVAVPAPITAPLAAVSQAASLATTSCSSNDSCDAISPFAEQQQLQQARDRLRRRSLPAMHLLEERSSLRDSCAMMANPPVFDNPLRRRGCCNHNHSESLSSYRAEAIERELRVKQINCGERSVMGVAV
uniref:Uncharacterized protein n=1 Tax=Tetradesmus obliquus TaxID=3088 RepID=A0A383VH47_TETOB|eukprot:jgi/Sobl393_1/790/SZX64531.1